MKLDSTDCLLTVFDLKSVIFESKLGSVAPSFEENENGLVEGFIMSL